MALFTGTVTKNGTAVEVTANPEDDILTIAHKALDIEFQGTVPIYVSRVLSSKNDDEYIFFELITEVPTAFADNQPLLIKSFIDIYYVTKESVTKSQIPKRIIKSFIEKGFNFIKQTKEQSPDQLQGESEELEVIILEFSFLKGI